MSRTTAPKSEYVSGLGKGFELVRRLSDAVRSQGGGDADLARLLSDDQLVRDLAARIVGSALSAVPALDRLIAQAKASRKLTWTNDNITEANFSDAPLIGELVEVNLGLTGYFSTEQALEAMDRLGYRPATMSNLAYHANHGWDGKTLVAALGSVWVDRIRGGRSVGFLWRDSAKRILDLAWVGVDWGSVYRFLGVRK